MCLMSVRLRAAILAGHETAAAAVGGEPHGSGGRESGWAEFVKGGIGPNVCNR
jgi:hypothetical protein